MAPVLVEKDGRQGVTFTAANVRIETGPFGPSAGRVYGYLAADEREGPLQARLQDHVPAVIRQQDFWHRAGAA
jgi:hypothetical protein